MVLDKQVHIASLGEYIEQVDVRNTELHYGEDDVMGISTTKSFISTKADLSNVSLSNYKIVDKWQFAYVADTSRRGDKIGLAFQDTSSCLVSSIYTTFRVKDESVLDPYYLMMYFKRPEFDRYARFHSWGSARETFTWEDMCNIQIPLPEIEVQREYVAVYKAMQHNLQTMQTKLDDLKLVCDGYIDQVKKTSPYISVGECVEIVDRSNKGQYIKRVCGVNIDKVIMPTNADTLNVDISRYKVLGKGNIVFSGMQTGRDNTIRMAIHTEDEPVVVSPAYTIFRIKSKKILSEYFMLWFLRKETDRRGWFLSDGSVRANLDMDRLFEDVQIPIPPIEVQKSIVAIYDVYNRRKQYAERLRQMINEMCPVLVAMTSPTPPKEGLSK